MTETIYDASAETGELKIAPPTVPCEDCLRSNSMMIGDGEVLVAHCPHEQAGGMYWPSTGLWQTWSRMNHVQFARVARDLAAKIGADLDADLAQLGRIN